MRVKKSSKSNSKKNNHRVVFNETKNEFFDADYIILIREECDFDDEDEDGVCTCYQHEMVRLTCCEPNCNCNYEDMDQGAKPQSPKFAPPIEFVDAVTLSPPEGYKDMELEEREMMAYNKQMARRQQRAPVCRECSATNEYEDEDGDERDEEKIDQSQQTTPTSPNNGDIKSIPEEKTQQGRGEDPQPQDAPIPAMGSPVSGILKGGKLWRQQSIENNVLKTNNELIKNDSISDEEGSAPRTVRFIEAEEKKDSCKSSPESDREVEGIEKIEEQIESIHEKSESEPTEMTLTFKLGNHVLISNNSLKPNSAVRQLFPCTKPLMSKDSLSSSSEEQYLVTSESLRAFEEAKRSKLPQVIQNSTTTSTTTNESIKRVIERNTLRRSLVRYEPKSKKNVQKTDNSLVERIKQLTCDIDDDSNRESDELSARVSPTGEEGNQLIESNQMNNKYKDRNFSPSSSSTTSSNSSSMSSTYRKITDLFGKREKPDMLPEPPRTVQTQTLPDIAGNFQHHVLEKTTSNPQISKPNKQFLAPLTACVGNMANPDEHYYHLNNQGSVTSSTGSEYTLDDIDEGLQNEECKKITPDVLAGTPASESGDELAVFVQQDANRIERIKKKYESDQKRQEKDKEEDEDQDDYGFNSRPCVRGIKPRFSSTTEILQQIQNQIHLPAPNSNISWPYYSETTAPRDDDSNRIKSNYQYTNLPAEDAKVRSYYRPESLYQNCTNQSCYKTQSYIEIDCNDYQTLPKMRNGRALSPPPQEISKTYHQTMVYIPYNHIEGYQPVPYDYYRYNQNQINNKKYLDPYYHHHAEDQYCNSNVPAQHKIVNKPPYQNNYQQQQQQHLMAPSSRSESPLGGNFSMARATQTSCMSSCSYYQTAGTQLRYRGSFRPPQASQYKTVVNRHSFPSTVRPRYSPPEGEVYEDPQNPHLLNGYYNYMPPKESPAGSPTKARFIERGVPEGAASISPQDSIVSSTTSPTMVTNASGKPLFYAMNV